MKFDEATQDPNDQLLCAGNYTQVDIGDPKDLFQKT